MNIQRTEQRIDSSPSAIRGISRRRFLPMMLAVPAGIIAPGLLTACSPTRPSPPLAAGPGPGESGQNTTGLRSLPADVKTAVSEAFTNEEPTTTLTREIREVIVTGNSKRFTEMVIPTMRYSPNRPIALALSPQDTAALRACENIPYQYLDELGPKPDTRSVTILYEELCVTRPSGKKVDRALFLWKKVSKEWYLTDYRL